MWTFVAHWWATGLALAEIAYCAAATWYLARSPHLQTVPVARCLLVLSCTPVGAAAALTLAGAAWWSLAVAAATSAVQSGACLRHLRMLQLIRTGRPPEQASFLIRRRAA
jgi:lysylphosphatidylglycerol synthetase-like protein (DUF2156 family)